MFKPTTISRNYGRLHSGQKRHLNKCLHIKGLPTILSKEDIYSYMSNYGYVEQLATYHEASIGEEVKKDFKKTNYITHDRLPGQTAIVNFRDTASAIKCREDLHWRPFPHASYTLSKEIIDKNARDRPLVNILYETEALRNRLRGWVVRDLQLSHDWIRKSKDQLKNRPPM